MLDTNNAIAEREKAPSTQSSLVVRGARKRRVVIAAVHTVIGEALAAAFRAKGGFATTNISAVQDLDFGGPNGDDLAKADIVIMELGQNRLTQEVAALALLRANPKARLATMIVEEAKVTVFQPGGKESETLENPNIETLILKITTS